MTSAQDLPLGEPPNLQRSCRRPRRIVSSLHQEHGAPSYLVFGDRQGQPYSIGVLAYYLRWCVAQPPLWSSSQQFHWPWIHLVALLLLHCAPSDQRLAAIAPCVLTLIRPLQALPCWD
jgi:hypothetical protein